MTTEKKGNYFMSPYAKENIEKYNASPKRGGGRRNLTGYGKNVGWEVVRAIGILCFAAVAYLTYEVFGMLYYRYLVPNFPKSWPNNAAMQDALMCGLLLVLYLVWYLVLRRKDYDGTVLFHRARTNEESPLAMPAYRSVHLRPSRRRGFSGRYQTPKIASIGHGIPVRVVYLLVVGLGIGGVASLWMMLVDAKLDAISWIHSSYKAMQSGVSALEGGGSILFSMLSVAVIGPVVEELLFRGVLVEYLGRLTSRKWVIILASGILFGVWHGNLVQGVYASLIGIVLALVLYQTKSILWPILLHILNNSIDVVTSMDGYSGISYPINLAQVILVAPMIVLLIFGVKLLGEDGVAGRRY